MLIHSFIHGFSGLRSQSDVAAALAAALLSGEQPSDELEFARDSLALEEAALRDSYNRVQALKTARSLSSAQTCVLGTACVQLHLLLICPTR